MNSRSALLLALKTLDKAYLGLRLGMGFERPGIRGLLFHTVLAEKAERENQSILPHQALTLCQYRFIFEYFQSHGYEFIGHGDLHGNLESTRRYAYVTFDDGYYNNIRLLPLAKELGVPIHLFVTTENVVENRKFWWDVVHSQGVKRGLRPNDIKREIAYLKTMTPQKINSYVLDKFGESACRPSGELDRPLTPEELKDVAEHELVTIGNHTHRHAIATNLAPIEFQEELDESQLIFEELLGWRPTSFAFPNGNFSGQQLDICKNAGFEIGFGCNEKEINSLDSYDPLDRLHLGRFGITNNLQLKWQADMIRSTTSIYRGVREVSRRWDGR
jgi:peptidoglycan/xylan/chitin deacetylase (PgdA/CDA1 family)